MNSARTRGLCVIAVVAAGVLSAGRLQADNTRPNVVLIMTDNHGAWTLGCYGNSEIRTPHIDRLAAEGTLFENAFACNPVCSPTRATVLTGLLPSQHGVHCFLRAGRLQIGPQARCTLEDVTSLPEILSDAGYRCGLVGKWHLGGNLQPQEGFDSEWVTMPHGGTSTFYHAQIIENGSVRTEPGYLTDFWTQRAVQFLQQQSGRPFFMFLSYNGPYALGRLLLREGQNRHAEYYRDHPLISFPREKPHPWQLHNLDYINNPVSIRRVATEVSGVDDGVGRVLQALQHQNLDRDTVVIFLADQGWVGGHGGFFGMGDHTRPVTAVDGMMRIPLIVRWPSRVAAGRRSQKLVAEYDVLPTLLDLLQLNDRVPRESPGQSFAAELTGRSSAKRKSGKAPGSVNDKTGVKERLPNDVADDVANDDRSGDQRVRAGDRDAASSAGKQAADERAVFYEFEFLRCIRTNRWKYVHRFPNGPHELYDLQQDPGEFDNLVSRLEASRRRGKATQTPDANGEQIQLWQKTLDRLQSRLQSFFDRIADPKYDLYHGGGSQTVLYTTPEPPETRPQPINVPAPVEEFQPQQLILPDGFSAELAAGPPLVSHPTMGCFDDRGRLFVCENAGVNMSAAELEAELPNSIRLLVDRDQDGRFDDSTVFADRMTFPMGAVWHDGSLYVASPPHIWRLTDTDDDGVADKRDVLVEKFGYTGNAASIHGCFLSPDGRIYWCDGYHGHEFRDAAGNVVSQRKGSYLFSCRPDGSDVRIHCGGGMDNPVEVDFTETSDVVGTVNILYTRPRVDAMVHWLYGGAYPHREAVLDELFVTGPLLKPMHEFGHVAVSGTTRYRSGVMNHRWRDDFFVTFFNSGRVVRLQLKPQGSTYTATQREFLSCDNRDFHPTDVIEDADGSLLVVDTGGWFYRGCPTSQMAKPDIAGGIYRIRRDGMTTVRDAFGRKIDWSGRTPSQLVQDLKDTRFAVRRKAVAECVRRGGAMVATLSKTLRAADIEARRNALRALGQISVLPNTAPAAQSQAQEAIRAALNDRDLSIRQAACVVLASNPDPAALPVLRSLVKHPHPPLRRAAWTAIGRAAAARDLDWMVAFPVPPDADRPERHARLYAVIETAQRADELHVTNAFDKVRPQLRADSELLVVADQLLPAGVSADVLVECFRAERADVVMAAAELLRKRSGDAQQRMNLVRQVEPVAVQRLAELFSEKASPNWKLIAALTAALPESAQISRQWAAWLASLADMPELQLRALSVLAGQPLTDTEELSEVILRSAESDDDRVSIAAIDAAGQLRLRSALERLDVLTTDTTRSEAVRLAALRAGIQIRGNCSDDVFEHLIQLCRSGSTVERTSAVQIISQVPMSPPRLKKIADLLSDAGPAQLPDFVRIFQRSLPTDVAESFLQGLERARSIRSLSVVDVSEVVKRFPAELRDRANRLLDRLRRIDEERRRKLDDTLELLADADPEEGERVFFSEKARCATCHVVGSRGKRIGPDLTSIGAVRRAEDLAESILFPSATIVRQYEPVTVVTQSGRTWSGLVLRDASDSITIHTGKGDPVTIDRADVEEIVPGTVSIMPAGLDEVLSPRQVANIVAWLQTLNARQPPADSVRQ